MKSESSWCICDGWYSDLGSEDSSNIALAVVMTITIMTGGAERVRMSVNLVMMQYHIMSYWMVSISWWGYYDQPKNKDSSTLFIVLSRIESQRLMVKGDDKCKLRCYSQGVLYCIPFMHSLPLFISHHTHTHNIQLRDDVFLTSCFFSHVIRWCTLIAPQNDALYMINYQRVLIFLPFHIISFFFFMYSAVYIHTYVFVYLFYLSFCLTACLWSFQLHPFLPLFIFDTCPVYRTYSWERTPQQYCTYCI